jgi:AcrR family transcriptional regulator
VARYRKKVTRAFRQQADEEILDRAAGLFARRGFAKTSVQDIADAVGLSKAGLLHHFISKDALYEAVLAQAAALQHRVLEQVGDRVRGIERDRRALEVLVDVALAHPGIVALMLAPALQTVGPEGSGSTLELAAPAFAAFGVDLPTASPERIVRVIGALAALAVLTLAAHTQNATTAWRPLIVSTCFDALGHPGA